MPVTKIKVRLVSMEVLDDSDWLWGAGEWHLHATADGRPIGSPATEFAVRSGDAVTLAEASWSTIVDVSAKAPGSFVEVKLKVIEHDFLSKDNLGEVKARIAYPFSNPDLNVNLLSPLLSGGWFFSDYRCYRAHFKITIAEEFATAETTGPTAVPVRRNAAGNVSDFSTIKGTAFTPRVEVCPVVPVPAPPAHMPTRPVMPVGLAAGVVPVAAQVTAAPSAPTLNALPNPPLIPILDAADPDLANRAARLALTYYEPGNLDTSKIHWKVLSGPAQIVGSRNGPEIRVRGTGNAADTMAEFEVRWESDTGPVLATYRAWVGKLGTIPYRVNFLNGTSGNWPTSTIMSSAEAHAIMQVVRAIVYQAGIIMVPDPTVTVSDGATLFPPGNADGIYQMTVSSNTHTRNVNHDIISRATRYNFRPGVLNFAFVHSTSQTNAAAVDRNGIAGVASKTQVFNGKSHYAAGGTGSTKQLDGSPSTSWIKPSGIPSDAKGVMQTLKTIEPTDRVAQATTMDKSYVTARNTALVPFTAAMMGRLYACHCPVVWGRNWLVAVPPALAPVMTNAQYTWNCGINLAHELGHILGLAHRGSGWSATAPLSGDGMDCANQNGVMAGHPWSENIMTYGYGLATPLAHDIDLIQASVVRAHPGVTY